MTLAEPRTKGQEDAIFANIEDEMFDSEQDIIAYELANLPGNPDEFVDPKYFDQRVTNRTIQLDVVVNRLHGTVMKHYSAFVEGIVQIQQITQELTTTSLLCTKGRKYLKAAQENAVKGSIAILNNNKRKKHLQHVQIYVKDMKRQLDRQLYIEKLLKETDFFAIIDVIKKAKEEEDMCMEVKSLKNALSGWQEGAMKKMLGKLDEFLRECCTNFSAMTYRKTLAGYNALGKLYEISGKLTKYYMERIEHISVSIVRSAALKHAMDKAEQINQQPFSNIMQYITVEDMLPTMLQLQQELAHILHNYYTMCDWHENVKSTDWPDEEPDESVMGDIRYGLKRSRRTVWETIQQRISNFITAYKFDSETFTFEMFLQVLHSCNMLMELGQHFVQANENEEVCLSLRGAMKSQCKSFLDAWHKKNVDKLKQSLLIERYTQIYMHLESLGDFTILTSPYITSVQRVQHNTFAHRFLHEHDPDANPFAIAAASYKYESAASNWEDLFQKDGKGETLPAELLKKIPDHSEVPMDAKAVRAASPTPSSPSAGNKPQYPPQDGVLFTQTTLLVTKLLCKYVKFVQVFPHFGLEVGRMMEQMLGVYIYTTYTLFGTTTRDHYIPDRDPQVPQQVREKLADFRRTILDYAGIDAETTPNGPENILYVQANGLQQQLYNSQTLFAIPERFTATFSWELPCKLLKVVSAMAGSVVPQKKGKENLIACAERVEKYALILKDIAMQRVCYHLFVSDHYVQLIEKAKEWDKKEMELGASHYVSQIQDSLNGVQGKIHNALLRLPCAVELVKQLWATISWNLWFVIVEGFSKVKKTTGNVRIQMKVDARTIEDTLKSLSGAPPKGLEYVGQYVQAGYLEEKPEFYDFVQRYSCYYSVKQFTALVNAGIGTKLKKKESKELISQIDGIVAAGRKQFGPDFSYDDHFRINKYMDDWTA
eukprot:TRINITY_DN67121_c3_g7_i1.p1 TRINITY_DN67121_c3_g7~~TRINITY_DN67121_c3_g7_i1.p1  ORF type:complete len:939 (+),score=92.23 TRINITY_DN67121_c3_g7_i1:39-2855(+)